MRFAKFGLGDWGSEVQILSLRPFNSLLWGNPVAGPRLSFNAWV